VNAVIALGIIAVIVIFTIGVGLYGVRNVRMNPQEFIVGGRSFGALLIWILLAGEIYTTFTFLGAAGWAYTRGAPAFYILCYGTVAYMIAYFLTPAIWRVARDKNLLTGPDFFRAQYGSRFLGGLTAAVGFIFLVPYVTLQLGGLQILLHVAGYNAFDARAAVAIAFLVMAVFVYFVGLRGTAWAAVVKDVLVLAGVIFAGVVLPIHFFGSPANVITKVLAQQPAWMTLQGTTTPNGTVWFVTTVLLTAMGFFMFPQSMAATYSARSQDTLRRSAVFLPFYQLMILLVYFGGFTALLVVPGLKGTEGDQSFMLVVQKYYSPWVLGFVAGAGCLAGLVPASAQMLGAASIASKNLFVDYGIVKTDAAATFTTRVLVLVVALLAFGFWFFNQQTLVGLLLIAYTGMTQFFPGVVLSFAKVGRPNAAGVGAGIIVGIVTLAGFAIAKTSTLEGVNSGIVALALNVVVLFAVSALTGAYRRGPRPEPARAA
jgi:SSS family solute:Na+ symporter